MKQIARNLIDVETSFLRDMKFLIINRDTKYDVGFRGFLNPQGIKSMRCLVRAPNCNACPERFVRSIKYEHLDKMMLFGEQSLRKALKKYLKHYQKKWNHQGVGNRLLEQPCKVLSIHDPDTDV